MKNRYLPRFVSSRGNLFSKISGWRFVLTASFLLIAISYIQLVNADFLYFDDDVLVLTNENIKKIDLNLVESSFGFSKIMHYHPLVYLSFAAEYSLFGLNPAYYHLTNILLHCLNTLLLCLLLMKLNVNRIVSSIVVLVFALHPLHVESVAWITERKDMLYSFFYLLALIAYVSFRSRRQKRFHMISLLMFIFSCLSKSMAVTLPLVLILIDHYLNVPFKTKFRSYIPYFIVSLVFIVINLEVAYYNLDVNDHSITHKFFMVCYSLLFYPYKIVFPFNLSVIYTYPLNLDYVHYLSALLLGLIYLIVRSNKHSLVKFGLSFYLVTIIPVLPFIPFGISFAADRFAYLPSVGLVLAFSAIVYEHYSIAVRKLPNVRFAMTGGFAVILIMYSVLTYSRCEKWRNSEVLMNDVLSYDINSPYAYFALGNYYTAGGYFENAIYNYKKFLQFKPDNCNALLNLGNAYFNSMKYEEAIESYSRLLMIDPDDMEALNNLGVVYENKGEISKAIEYYKKSAILGYKPARKVLIHYGY